jgi:hypothetical protein
MKLGSIESRWSEDSVLAAVIFLVNLSVAHGGL